MRAVCQIKFAFVKFVFKKNLVFKHQEQRIREICEIRVPKNIRVIREIRVPKKYSCYPRYYLPAVSGPSANLVFKKISCSSVQKNIRVIRIIRVQKNIE